ncbi:hypothetical protein IMY05_010G0132000 [Salix suchowensis]|nr:hypothetical protein IMY05_010G0132000 [Salix suchowensis]
MLSLGILKSKENRETQLQKASLASSFIVKQHFLRGQFSFLCSNKTGFGVCLASKLELVFINEFGFLQIDSPA